MPRGGASAIYGDCIEFDGVCLSTFCPGEVRIETQLTVFGVMIRSVTCFFGVFYPFVDFEPSATPGTISL